ncbi:MAG: DNA polymerase III subunit epsilon [Alphaproteobacteria bacterium]|nr:DNA polymerase III subunit epsilon [Alphaproteobacteria bacterium]
MRHIIFDTETTGFEPSEGHRIVEIGALEMVDYRLTGKEFHCYINPERSMPDGAYQVHGLGDDFLADKPIFSAVADDFLIFIDEGILVAHNAAFDMKFIESELDIAGYTPLENQVEDTLLLARKQFVGGKNSLDKLADRFGIDRTMRDKHGALLDAKILADVFLALKGKMPADESADLLAAIAENAPDDDVITDDDVAIETPSIKREKIIISASETELQAHQKMCGILGEKSLWSAH